MLIDWLAGLIFFGLLLAWSPSAWAIGLAQAGSLLFAAAVLVQQMLRPALAASHAGVARLGRTLQRSPDVAILVLLVLWGPLQISAGLSELPYETWNNAVGWLTLAAVYLLARKLLASRRARQRFLAFEIWAGTILALLSVILHFNSPHRIFWLFETRYAAFGPFVYKNQFSAFLEILLPVAFYLMITAKRGRLTYAMLYAALFACVVASLSRAGVAIAVLETAALAILSWNRGLVSARVLRNVGVPLVLFLVLFTSIVGVDAIWNRFREQNPYAVRSQLTQSTLRMIEARPLTGFGLGTWQNVYPQFATFDIARFANQAHNDWLQWAADGGIPFALLLLGFVVWVSRLAWKNMWGLGVPAVFLHALVDYPTRNPALAAFLFLFAGALAATGARRRARESEDPEWRVLSVRTAAE